MAIYKITVTTNLYFYGDDFPDDRELADAAKEEIEAGCYDSSSTSIDSLEGLPGNVLNSYPWGEDGDRHTVKEWLLLGTDKNA